MSIINLANQRSIQNLIYKVVNHQSYLRLSVRTLLSQSQKSRSNRDEKHRVNDKILPTYHLVYNAPMRNYFSASNIITSITTVLLGGMIVATYTLDNMYVSDMEIGGLTASSSDLLVFLASFAIFNLAIRRMIHIYPLRIYRNKSKYIAIFESQIPLMTRKVAFNKGEVYNLPAKGIMPWRDSRYRMGAKASVLLLPEYFKSSSELYNMLRKEVI